ncbi:CLUMA_CG014845, isoform A [Clunio marinus]|uniref:CLUMA_CG014845, isoform A n=1 Tax=Clunio marinus TaxID=568069 RepID=A0A1J1IQU1_9DIPT|nr:CLUMA_CG014845, isoform A [Clunio marinus]
MNLLCKDSSKKASENLKCFNYFSYAYLTFYLILAISSFVIMAYDSKLSNENTQDAWPFETNMGIFQDVIILQTVTAICVTEIFGLCFQCCYFNICMNIRMLYDKVLNEYQNLIFYHVISYKKELKDIFTSLQRIKLIINEINECFKMVIFISFSVDVLTLGVFLSMIEDIHSIVTYFVYTPFVLYDVWVYCYGSSLMVEKIEEISSMIYDKTWWFMLKSEKKMFRTLLQYTQRPLKIKVFIWDIDRELLILFIRFSYSVFNFVVMLKGKKEKI